jgi:hypothetical protein
VSTAEKIACTAQMPRWLIHNADGLWEDTSYAVRFVFRPIKRRLLPGSRREAQGARSGK